MLVDLSIADILQGLQIPGASFSSEQFTFSIPVEGSTWPTYELDSEPFSGSYSVVSQDQATSFRLALGLWDELIAPDFSEIIESADTFGEVRVAFTEIDTGAAGYAYSGTPQAPGTAVGDIWIDSDTSGEEFIPGNQNFDTFIHEIGHTLGLKHPFEEQLLAPEYDSLNYTVMSYTSPGFFVSFAADGQSVQAVAVPISVNGPMVLDIAAVQEIYGAETDTRTGDDIYVFVETVPVVNSIYDAGGNDTIDVSNFTLPNIIDLRPGAYSSIGFFEEDAQRDYWKGQFPGFASYIDGVFDAAAPVFEFADNLGIAFTTIIENAFGGMAADSILGNDAANELRGNAGNDTLEGGMGDDTLMGGDDEDTAVFSGNRSDYLVAQEGGALRLTDQRSGDNDGSDLAEDIEIFRFADGDVLAAELLTGNQAPVALPATANATEDGPVVTGQLEASDPDGDTLTFSPVLTGAFAPGVAGLEIFSDGSYSFDPSDPAYQSLAEGEMQELLGGYFVSDGELTDSSELTITITGVNDAPVIDPAVLEFATTANTSAEFSVAASDVDGDTLAYMAADPDHGTVTGGTDGQFTYTPDQGYLGIDTVTVTVTDGHGGSAMQSYVVTVNPPSATDWRLFASDGFMGEIGGSGQVFGTAGLQDIAVLDVAGSIAFDPSFNKGGDIVRLAGNAGDWQVAQSGSAAIFSDGDTFVQIPVGTAGIAVLFDDGVRTLLFDQGAASMKIGAQSFANEAVQITAPTDETPLPTGADPQASARLFLGQGQSASVGGNLDVFGTSGAEQVTVTKGDITLDGSFNKGGDTLVLGEQAPDFLASRSGSSVLLDSDLSDVLIPVGTAGMTLSFPAEDDRTLLFNTILGNPTIGSQEIDTTPTALAAFG
ncbi:MAG: cadherin-like domain-containing protein [Novosphingobium sp.]|nr:cadherin-like domain-containing protein [Novosphingobium sp.]MCP5404427.1 cadherin-like domain-containing protein [Novosphingobium sp.]